MVAKPGSFGVWKFLGREVCFQAWCRLTGLSRQYVGKLLQHLRGGQTEPPVDQRRLRAKRDEPKADHVRTWFSWLWTHFAEPLAEDELEREGDAPVLLVSEFHEAIMDKDGPVAMLTLNTDRECRPGPRLLLLAGVLLRDDLCLQVPAAHDCGRALLHVPVHAW